MKTTKITAAFSVALLSALTLFTPLSNATEDSSNNQSPTALQPCIASIPEAQTLNLEEAGSNFSRELLPNASPYSQHLGNKLALYVKGNQLLEIQEPL